MAESRSQRMRANRSREGFSQLELRQLVQDRAAVALTGGHERALHVDEVNEEAMRVQRRRPKLPFDPVGVPVEHVLRSPVAAHQPVPRGELTLETQAVHGASVRGSPRGSKGRLHATVHAVHMDPRTRTLFEVNIEDILLAFGWQGVPALRGLVRRLARLPALRFAREMTMFDDAVEASGIATAARALLSSYVRGVRVNGADRIPRNGPVLLLSNHPGMTDTLALFAAIPRVDLLAIASERPFLRALPAARRSLVFIPGSDAAPGGRPPPRGRGSAHLPGG